MSFKKDEIFFMALTALLLLGFGCVTHLCALSAMRHSASGLWYVIFYSRSVFGYQLKIIGIFMAKWFLDSCSFILCFNKK